jgi:hypothetical protein
MKFHLNFIPDPSPFKIDHQSKILLCGSCFSDNIGEKLNDHGFPVSINPLGIFFNPVSLAESLLATMDNTPAEEGFFVKRDSAFVSYLHHSRIWSEDKEGLAKLITAKRRETEAFLKEAGYLVITFGTAYSYVLRDQQKVVANCHKQPSDRFEKKLLTIEEIVELYEELVSRLSAYNPSLKIIFTVSPVKYIKDGVIRNTLSKSALCLAVNQLVSENPHCFYFPAYELVTDDLRDYRFYKEDLAHPNQLAIDYVWEKFSGCFFNEHTILKNTEIEKVNRQKAHRSLHTKGDANER